MNPVKKRGDQILPPFFSTTELLRLSGCCKSMKSYHHHISEVMIKPSQKDPSSDDDDGELEWKSDKKLTGALGSITRGEGWQVKRLFVISPEQSAEHHDRGIRITTHGWLGLEELVVDVSDTTKTYELAVAVTSAIEEGAYSTLRKLEFEYGYRRTTGEPPCKILSRALASGHCQELQHLKGDVSKDLVTLLGSNHTRFASLCYTSIKH